MKFRAEHDEFATAIGWVTRTVGARVTLPALAGVLLEADDGRLTCRATDLEVAAEVSVPVQITEPGKVLLPGKLLAQLVARFPDAAVEVSGGPDGVEVTCGRSTFHVRGMPVEDFPALPTPDPDVTPGTIRSGAFGRLVGQVARAAATDEARPALTGVKLTSTATELAATATDAYRLATRTVPWETGVEAESLVPSRALQEAAKAASDSGGSLEVILEQGQATFRIGDRRLTTQLIEGKAIDAKSLVPDAFEITAIVDRDPLMEALQRVAIVAQGRANSPVNLVFAEGSVDLRVSNQEVGDASEALPADIDGEDITIAFNPAFLQAGLDAIGTDRVEVLMNGELKPAVLRPHHDADDEGPVDDYTYLIMPMRP
ncbi:DNA polymerase III subunit beta [Salsipaludibacter albus]|uniref:DNA polymerase III subunit beta n=1 Tax=Salsipaludibacter albus TaxID=2849650 RepID=UPI001EE432DA|nr:DNA polymerase III subunit beta [Salsipaludibacter albus]